MPIFFLRDLRISLKDFLPVGDVHHVWYFFWFILYCTAGPIKLNSISWCGQEGGTTRKESAVEKKKSGYISQLKSGKCSGLKGKEKLRVNSKCTPLLLALPQIEKFSAQRTSEYRKQGWIYEVQLLLFSPSLGSYCLIIPVYYQI